MIILIRHAESAYNDRFRSGKTEDTPHDLDSSITTRGIQQCSNMVEHLAYLDVSSKYTLYCSPYQRTIQTANFIADEFDLNPIIDDRIKEVELECAGFDDDLEDEKMIVARLDSFLEDIMNSENIIVVSHGCSILTMRNLILGHYQFGAWQEPDKIRNCEILVF